MANYAKSSLEKLESCHPDLQIIFKTAVTFFDNSIIVGHRDKEGQDKAIAEGKSKTPWPTSKHNSAPSMAVDATPFPIDWNDRERFFYFAGIIIGIAEELYKQKKITHKIRWGGCWKMDNNFKANTFDDLCHFELVSC